MNMSSVGILIATDRVLSPGSRVELDVDGPFQVDDQVFFKLIVTGRIVRTERGSVPLAGLKITSHEFRTTRDRPIPLS